MKPYIVEITSNFFIHSLLLINYNFTLKNDVQRAEKRQYMKDIFLG